MLGWSSCWLRAESPIAEADDPDELAALVEAYHEHVEGYLATTRPPHNTERYSALERE